MSTVTQFVFSADTTLEEVSLAYAAATVSEKAAMRADHKAAVFAAAMAKDGDLAQHLVGLESGMVATKVGPAQVDWSQRVSDRVATLRAAADRLESGLGTMPEGVTFPEGDLPEGVVDSKEATLLATVSGRKSGRGSVAGWIESVLGDEPATIADLRAAWVPTDDYPQSAPSAGAIGACLDRDGGAEFGFEVTDIDGKKGAVRA